MAEATLNDVSQKLSSQMRVQEATARAVNGLRDDFQKLYGIQEKLLRQMAEAAREGKGATSSKGGGAPGSEEKKSMNPFLAAALVAAVALVTAVKDYFKNVTKLLRNSFKPIAAALRGLGRLFAAIFREAGITKIANNISKSIRGIFQRMGRALRMLVPDLEPLRDGFKALKGYFGRIKAFFTTGPSDFIKFLTENSIFKTLKTGFIGIRDFLFGSFDGDEIKAVKDFFGRIGQTVSDFFKPIRNFFSADGPLGKVVNIVRNAFSFASEGSGFLKSLRVLGRVIGKLAWPIGILMSVVDAVTGAFKGFVNTEGTILDKVIGGIAGGISGFYEGIIGAPLDLIKDIVAWIAGKFGFEGAQKMLDDFSFQDLIRDMIMSPFVMIKRGINAIIEAIAAGVDSIPFPGVGKAAKAIRKLKFEDTGESRTEMVARKKAEDKEAGEALDAYEQQEGKYTEKKFNTKKMAQIEAKKLGQSQTMVEQDDEGKWRVLTPKGVQMGRDERMAKKDVAPTDVTPPATGPTGAPIIVNDNSNTVSGGGTTLAGETRPSTANGQALKTDFYRSSGGF